MSRYTYYDTSFGITNFVHADKQSNIITTIRILDTILRKRHIYLCLYDYCMDIEYKISACKGIVLILFSNTLQPLF